MCLLFSGKSATVRSVFLDTHGLIQDVYGYNSDGFGVMYHTTQGIKVIKQLPKSAADVRKMIEALPNDDREVAVHARMRTHGAIDKENCHPYPIGHGAWLMHNGILDTGNDADTTKSDTWHFARDYMSTLDADTLHNPQYLKLLGEFIDNNRFVLATADGRMSWVNADQGVQAEGIVFSNTYAWSPEILIPTYYKPRAKWATRAPRWDDADPRLSGYANSFDSGCSAADDLDRALESEDMDAIAQLGYTVEEALHAFDSKTLELCMEADPASTVEYILDNYYVEAPTVAAKCPAPSVQKAWVDGDVPELMRAQADEAVAVLLYHCNVEAAYA